MTRVQLNDVKPDALSSLTDFGLRTNAAAFVFADSLNDVVEQQDPHFHWLARLVVASALSIGIALVKLR